MSFQDEMRTAYRMSHSPAALEARQAPGDHDYLSAGQYLDGLKRQIRRQLRNNPPNRFTARGSVLLAGEQAPRGYEHPSDFLLLDGISSPSPFRQTLSVYLTKRATSSSGTFRNWPLRKASPFPAPWTTKAVSIPFPWTPVPCRPGTFSSTPTGSRRSGLRSASSMPSGCLNFALLGLPS